MHFIQKKRQGHWTINGDCLISSPPPPPKLSCMGIGLKLQKADLLIRFFHQTVFYVVVPFGDFFYFFWRQIAKRFHSLSNKCSKAPLTVFSFDSKNSMFRFFSSSDVLGPSETISLIPSESINSFPFLMLKGGWMSGWWILMGLSVIILKNALTVDGLVNKMECMFLW